MGNMIPSENKTSFGLSTHVTFVCIFCLIGFGVSAYCIGQHGASSLILFPLALLIGLPVYLYLFILRRITHMRSDLLSLLTSPRGKRVRHLGFDDLGGISFSINQLLEKHEAIQSEYEQTQTIDSVTGLPNRSHFLQAFQARLESGAAPPALALIALERFQRLNDSLGTLVGDQILYEVAQRLCKIHDVEQVSRVSGSEFALLISHTSDLNALTRFSENTRTWIEAPIPIDSHGGEVHLKIRIGITAQENMQNLGALEILRRGEAALHHSHTDNTRTLAMFNADLDTKVREQIELEKDLRRAIHAKEFLVAFQPIQNASTNELAGFEALVRWKHPVRGMISPMAFIPLAEELGLIEELGAQILSTACKQVMDWSLTNPALSNTFISVNLSPKQFYDPLLLSKVWHAVQSSGLPYSRLKLEITESSIMDNPEDCSRRLNALHDLGIRLSLDDFGTGFSSFIHLDRFPVSTLKLDKSFVDKLLKDPDSPIVRSVATVAKVMGYDLIAEGVEDASQAECLRNLGCGYIQGYLYAKPMFPEMLMEWYGKLNAFREPENSGYVGAQTM